MKALRLVCSFAAAVALMSIGAFASLTSTAAGAIDPPVRLATYFSQARGDYFTTSDTAWNNCTSCAHAPDYVFKGYEGYVADPAKPQPPGTVPLYHWYSAAHGDNFLTTNPAWAGTVGTVRNGYRLFRIEGYVWTTQTAGTTPLQSWWSPSRLNNATSAGAAWGQQPSWATQLPDYTRFRTEGFVMVPNLIVNSVVVSAGSQAPDGTWTIPVVVTVKNTGAATATPPYRVTAETNEQGGTSRPLRYTSGAGAGIANPFAVMITAPIAANGTVEFRASVNFSTRPAAGIVVTLTADSCSGVTPTVANSYCVVLESSETDNGRNFTTA